MVAHHLNKFQYHQILLHFLRICSINANLYKKKTLPSELKSIGKNVFNGCRYLIYIKIPSSVNKIESGAFKGCKSLVEISISSSITSIMPSIFEDCSSLLKLEIPSSERN